MSDAGWDVMIIDDDRPRKTGEIRWLLPEDLNQLRLRHLRECNVRDCKICERVRRETA